MIEDWKQALQRSTSHGLRYLIKSFGAPLFLSTLVLADLCSKVKNSTGPICRMQMECPATWSSASRIESMTSPGSKGAAKI